MGDIPASYEDCMSWKIRACAFRDTPNCWNTSCPDHDHSDKPHVPLEDEKCEPPTGVGASCREALMRLKPPIGNPIYYSEPRLSDFEIRTLRVMIDRHVREMEELARQERFEKEISHDYDGL